MVQAFCTCQVAVGVDSASMGELQGDPSVAGDGGSCHESAENLLRAKPVSIAVQGV